MISTVQSAQPRKRALWGWLVLNALAMGFGASPAAAQSAALTVEREDQKVRVLADGQVFTEYLFGPGMENPVLYPVVGPQGVGLTRNWPLKDGVAGEEKDHPHHRSLWYSHGLVNGVDFWTQRRGARIVQRELLEAAVHGDAAVIRTANDWVTSEGQTLMSDERTVVMRAEKGVRMIDFNIELKAAHGDITLGDTKEGTMAIRTIPSLRLEPDPEKGVMSVSGKAINSEGVEGKEIWGKHAAWVDYWGDVPAADGGASTVGGIAILDHPSNPRHPTTWHAREYGLVAVNPFGLRDFERAPRGTGDLKIANGESVRFSYRFIFHEGGPQQARIAERFAEYAKISPVAH